MMSKYFSCLLLLCSTIILGQQGIELNTDKAMNGYLLFETSNSSYLVDNCGEIVHEWQGIADTELHAKLQEDGSLRFIRWDEKTLEIRDWDNNLVYSYTVQEADLNIVYEAIKKPNGNYLCVSRRYLSDAEFGAIGYDMSAIENFQTDPRRIDGIVEIDPVLNQIVWEWNIKDHVIQQRDSSAPNFGSLQDNPQLLDIDAIINTFDWQYGESFMINGFDYNPELEQLALSVRKMGEVVIIDQSTTTEEARGSSGGNSGKGGDILYRFGNPQNYNRGTAEDRILYYQHNPNWILYGEHKGKLMCFNNGLDRPDVFDFDDRFSSVPIFDPVENGYNFEIEDNQAFQPIQPEIQYNRHTTGTFFYSSYTSGAKMLPNGNIFITEGVDGVVFEIDATGEKVWQYDADEGGGAYLFRSERYPADYPAFEGKDLTSNGQTVEFPSSPYDCELIVSNEEITIQKNFTFTQFDQSIYVETKLPRFDLTLLSSNGKKIEGLYSDKNEHFDISDLKAGLYFLVAQSTRSQEMETFKFIKK